MGDMGRGRGLLPLRCPLVQWRWLPRVMSQVLSLLQSYDGSWGCAHGCCGHARDGWRRGQLEGCQEEAVASASTVQALVTSLLGFGGL